MNKRAFFRWLTVAVATLSLAACGGGSDSESTSTPATIRLVNLTSVSDLKLNAGTTTYNSGVTAGAASSYANIDAGTYSVIVSSAAGSLTSSTTTSMTFSSTVRYSVVAFERGGQIKLLALTDSVTESDIADSYAQLTVFNAGADAGTLDVYVVSGTTDLTDLSATFASVAGTGTSLTQTTSAGTYNIIVTGANKPKDVRLTLTGVSLASKKNYSLILTPTTSGTLVNGALVPQAGTPALTSNTKARVRIVPSFGSANVAVSAVVGGTSVSSVTSPSVGTYALVSGNTSTYSVSVANTPATVPAKTFAGGGDYTILVYGTSSASPSVTVIKDDNRLPTTANIRLINAAVSTGGLSLVANNVTLFSEIAFGTASDYTGVTTGSNKLDIYSPISGFGTSGFYTQTNNLLAGGVYTLFVLGPTTGIEVLSKDR